ncbi:uncharacterized protein J4E79_001641 [Alternaria viburni]|uniref:uncharacterized protein n=1 Tax=Alternaria viburni TaxID=566460 RepID=UPI0020C20C2E|nr:uncharacterized protein J4E79_001641 [Alternaria viburni]KAI4666960.1 hypothetical protein J4E79_001641 [Alternaria viburni]
MAQPQQLAQEWNSEFQRYVIPFWDKNYGRYYWQHYIEGQGWTFFDWAPVGWVPAAHAVPPAQSQVQFQQPHIRSDSVQTVTSSGAFYVRGSAFFEEGKVFSVLFTEPAGTNALNGLNPMADYNTNLSSNTSLSRLVQGEAPLRKAPIPIEMEENNRALVPASRIYFAIHHPIQYNVKVKNLGHVHPDYIPTFLGYWNQENTDSQDDPDVAQNPNNTDNF